MLSTGPTPSRFELFVEMGLAKQLRVWIFTVSASESAPVLLLVQRKSGGESPHLKGIKGESDTLSTSISRFLQRSKGVSNKL